MASNQTSQDILMDSYLKLVGEEYARNLEAEFDQLEDDGTYPESLDLWFNDFNNKLKREIKRKKKKISPYRHFRGMAAAIVAILIVSTIISLNADAIRVEVLNFFIEETKTNMHIEAGRKIPGDSLLDEYNNLYVLSYVPKGYVLEDIINFNSMFRMSYIYQDKKINFSQEQGEIDIQIDNERSVISEYILSTGESAILSKGDGYSMIIWENNLRTFIISGDVDTDTIIKMAENIVWKE